MRTACLLTIAMVLCSCAPDHTPTAAQLTRTGGSSFRRGDFSSATIIYEQAGELAPDASEPFYNLALAYYRTGLYDMTLRYLDRIQTAATGSMRIRCLLLRGDVEYRRAMADKSMERVEGLQRALHWYRDALAAGSDNALHQIARYDVEVVKLKLPVARGDAPQVRASDGVDDTPPDQISPDADPTLGQQRNRKGSAERDW